ncbi:HlyD family efflux transporter periplasmic adaptor subunit [Pedobacter panaciterrae]|uniref:HlyD family efflux transporter periplasmic adaptor subunit n=1 Tax=Pedobacter panaciterrae TaxID=363849 RepID=UPI002592F574|nr:HlyD family efflux transporter periplasmic adaptor subunit [uncultured Pedobacter sp.]
MEKNLHSDDLNDIISKPPTWPMKYGTSAMLLFLFLILFLSSIIKYPNTILLPIRITTENTPKTIINRNDGVIIKIFVTDGTLVDSNQVIAYLESSANHGQLTRLLTDMRNFKEKGQPIILRKPEDLQLGEMQDIYENLFYRLLRSQSVVYSQSNITQIYLRKNLDKVVGDDYRKLRKDLNDFIQAGETWKRNYVLVSPAKGKLLYSKYWQVNQHIREGEVLSYIKSGSEKFIGEMFVPQAHISDVKVNQNIQISVNGFPSDKFGYLTGKLSYISEILYNDSTFFSKVELKSSLDTPKMTLRPGLSATASIVSSNESILTRIRENLAKSLNFKQ